MVEVVIVKSLASRACATRPAVRSDRFRARTVSRRRVLSLRRCPFRTPGSSGPGRRPRLPARDEGSCRDGEGLAGDRKPSGNPLVSYSIRAYQSSSFPRRRGRLTPTRCRRRRRLPASGRTGAVKARENVASWARRRRAIPDNLSNSLRLRGGCQRNSAREFEFHSGWRFNALSACRFAETTQRG